MNIIAVYICWFRSNLDPTRSRTICSDGWGWVVLLWDLPPSHESEREAQEAYWVQAFPQLIFIPMYWLLSCGWFSEGLRKTQGTSPSKKLMYHITIWFCCSIFRQLLSINQFKIWPCSDLIILRRHHTSARSWSAHCNLRGWVSLLWNLPPRHESQRQSQETYWSEALPKCVLLPVYRMLASGGL